MNNIKPTEKEDHHFTMGSLFDGSGGFPLASLLCGIEPVWASEIEPFPIKVTKKRFPNMKHYGDISNIHGYDLEPVDLIAGGSPCQSLSIAGKRDGMSKKCINCGHLVLATEDSDICPVCGGIMAYTRSGLFMEQIRIIKEMREKDELGKIRSGKSNESIRPRFMLWENVTGAFSSNKGEDFRAVLEETARIVDKTAVIPRPPKGKWNNAGLIMGDGYSIAWRVLDAQFWGVPQRRRRIALVADLGGQCAGEILFKRDGLQRNFTESRQSWQSLTRCFAESIGETGQYSIDFGRTADRIQGDGYKESDIMYTLNATEQHAVAYDCRNMAANNDVSGTLQAKSNCGQSLNYINSVFVKDKKTYSFQAFGEYKEDDVASCMKSRDAKDDTDLIVETEYIVRRLTPLECSRLQGFPDCWTDGIEVQNPTEEELQFWTEVFETHRKIVTGAKKPKTEKQIVKWLKEPDTDGAKYKLWGNGIALPCFLYVIEGIKDVLERDAE